MEERLFLYGLSKVKGLGSMRLEALISRFGSASDVWHAKPEHLKSIKGIPAKVIDDLVRLRLKLDIEQEMEILAGQGISVYTIEDKEYPSTLKNIYKPPLLIYVKGKLPEFKAPVISIVGARKCTLYGRKMATDIAKGLARAGITVVSGMARGIDSAAHKGCLEEGGKTVAVLGTGVNEVYPKENNKLMQHIMENGAVLSEYTPDQKALPGHFPMRNRIISGLSDGVLIVEAAKTSGSLITADLALEQGKDVFAVPGPITSSLSKGTNSLIKQGAKLVDCIEDILEEYDITLSPVEEKKDYHLTTSESLIMSKLNLSPLSMEEIIEITKLPVIEVSRTLTYLELKGLVQRVNGSQFVINL